ncbi:zinc finger protein 271 [Anopheles gambiae]|uniref:zinc finger protein 271 n=1 Tax=Anopheles gambiae TaxID=7165 RepID=UPI002AC9A0E0|nr:zinc finger protein 271 [Anopheles gambiae]
MSLLTDTCSSETIPKAPCIICEERIGAMGSILCPETDTAMLDKIYASTNIRVQPRKGIITPVCECCRTRIDDYDASFKPYLTEYVAVPGECFPEDAFSASVDPLADASFKEQSSSNDDVLDKGKDEVDGLVSDKQDLCNDVTSARGNAVKRGPKRKAAMNWQNMSSFRKPTECSVCGKQVKSMSDHMKVHSTDKKYKCTFCDKSFAQSNNLAYHLRKHTGEKPYKCDKCDKQFINKPHLLSHLKLHYDQKVFQCEVCSKLFNHVGNFNKHRRVHCGEKPYACEYCEMRFSNSSNKKAHEKRHRDEGTIVCEVCSKRFHDMHHLERHKTVHRKSRKGEN